jgi:uncharacterized membrane protein
MIAGGTTLPANLRSLAWCAALGMLAAQAWWVGQVYWRNVDGRALSEEFLRAARWVSGLNALIPLMYVYWGWRNRWPDSSVAAIVVAAALGLGGAAITSRAPAVARWLSRVERPLSRVLVISVALCALVGMAWIGVLRHRSFNSGAMDLAMMDQLVWNTAHGRLLQGAFTGQYAGSFLKHHFSPILAALAPLYWLWSSPEALILVQAAAIALSAVCLYAAGVRLTGQHWASACVAAGLLVHPALHDGVLFDFHQDALAMLFLSFGVMCVARERWAWAGIGWLLSLSCKEEVAVYWIAIAAYLAAHDGVQRWRLAAFGLLNAVCLLVILYLIMPAFDREPGWSFQFVERYGEWGATPLAWAVTFAANPVYVLRTMIVPMRVWGAAILLVPASILLWKVGPAVLVLLSPLAINLLSNLDLQYGFTLHYAMLPLIIVCIAALYGAKNWSERARLRGAGAARSLQGAGSFALVGSLVLFAWLSPLGPRLAKTLQQYEVNAHDEIGQQIVAALPPEACVVAQNALLPHLSQRECMGLFPLPMERNPDYYVLDVTGHFYPLSPETYPQAVRLVLERPEYGPTQIEDGYIVLGRGAGRSRVPEALRMLAEMGPTGVE